eukprot:5719719-Pyramimonas_sp.AAC.1
MASARPHAIELPALTMPGVARAAPTNCNCEGLCQCKRARAAMINNGKNTVGVLKATPPDATRHLPRMPHMP